MRRWLVLFLPGFRVERCGHRATDVVALTVEEYGATRLCAVSPEAGARGISPGMTAAEARSLEPEISLEPLDPAAEDEDRLGLLRALERLADAPWPLGDEAFALEISRVPRRDATWEDALALAAELGHVARAVVADDPDAAYALARWGGESRVVEPGGTAAAVASLPLSSLCPSADLLAAWREIGLATVQDLARLPAAAIADRYGAEGRRLHRLARGEPPDPVLRTAITTGEPAAVRADAALPGPTTGSAPLWFVVQGLIGQVAERVARQDRAVVRLLVQLGLERGLTASLRARSGRPTASADRLRALVRPRIEALRIEAPAVDVAVVAEETAPLRHWQGGLYDRAEAQEPLPDLVARLTDALGEACVFTPALAPRWRPERAWSRVGGPTSLFQGALDALPERPSLLEPHPVSVEVQAEGDRPLRVRLGEAWETVRRARGPERLSGDWWRPDAFDRSYWVVDVGVVAWLFRDASDGRWFLHGWYD